MPSRQGLQRVPYRGKSLAPRESRHCTEVEFTPAILLVHKPHSQSEVIGSNGPSCTFKEDQPRGTLLFTISINDLLAEFKDDSFVSGYADDQAIANSAHNKDMIIASLQQEVDNVVEWSAKARLTLNSSKCEMAFFCLDCAEVA